MAEVRVVDVETEISPMDVGMVTGSTVRTALV